MTIWSLPLSGWIAGVLALADAVPVAAGAEAISWTELQPGVDYATVRLEVPSDTPTRDPRLHLVRIDPKTNKLTAVMAAQTHDSNRTAGAWTRSRNLVVAINLGMYHTDHATHVGHLRSGTHINSARWIPSYKSLFLFGARAKGDLPVRFVDLDRPPRGKKLGPTGFAIADAMVLSRYDIAVQNLRLIKQTTPTAGVSVWSAKATKRWSEAALAADRNGRVLFLFTRVPLTMAAFNALVLSLPLQIVHAAHLEGGPEASLSIRSDAVTLDLAGSFETGFLPDDSNTEQWPIPNVLGVVAVKPVKPAQR